jgi:hypothetical protein
MSVLLCRLPYVLCCCTDHATEAGLESDDDHHSEDIHAGADAVSVTHQLRLLSRNAASDKPSRTPKGKASPHDPPL